jgi:hypothetical protein
MPRTFSTDQLRLNNLLLTGDENGLFYNGSQLSAGGGSAAQTSTQMIAGSGLVGGGTLAADRTFDIVGVSGLHASADSIGISAGGVTNDMLAGSIDNAKLANSSLTVTAGDGLTNGGSISLGGSATLNVVGVSGLHASADAIGISAGGVTNSMLAGSIENAKLSNSAITIAGNSTSLGGSITADTIAGQISAGTIANSQLANNSVTVTAGDGLQDGGSISLGGSATVNVDSTVVRTTSNQTIAGNKTFNGDIVINNLSITGSFAHVDVTTLTVEDNTILLNSGEAGAGVTAGTAGLEIDRGSEANYLIMFDEASDRLKIGITGSEASVISEAEFETVSQAISNSSDSVELTFANTYSSAPNVVVCLHNSNQEEMLSYYVSGVSTTKATVILSAAVTSTNYTMVGFVTSS